MPGPDHQQVLANGRRRFESKKAISTKETCDHGGLHSFAIGALRPALVRRPTHDPSLWLVPRDSRVSGCFEKEAWLGITLCTLGAFARKTILGYSSRSRRSYVATMGGFRYPNYRVRFRDLRFFTSPTRFSGSTPKPAASWNTVVMLGCRLFRSSSASVVGCNPANSASFSWVSLFSFRSRCKMIDECLGDVQGPILVARTAF